MAGGPSQLETFDYKPELKRAHGQPFPESFTKGQQLAQLQNAELKARGPFVRVPEVRQVGPGDLRPVPAHRRRSPTTSASSARCTTEQINHDPAHAFMNTGSIIKGRPSMGSWLLYGLGAETDRPARLHRAHLGRARPALQPVSARQWSAGFLPSKFQGIQFQSKGDAVHYIGNPEGVCQSTQHNGLRPLSTGTGCLGSDWAGSRPTTAGPRRVAAGLAARNQDDEAGQAVGLGPKAVKHPRAHARPALMVGPAVHERMGRIVIDLLGRASSG